MCFVFFLKINQPKRNANRYLGTFEFMGSQQNSCRKKRSRKIRVCDPPPVCRMISAWLRKTREPGLPLQVMSFQRVLHWCRCSAQQPRELQGGFQAPEAKKRWHSTSGSAPAEVEHVGAFFHLLAHALTLGTQTQHSTKTSMCADGCMIYRKSEHAMGREPKPTAAYHVED